MSKCRTIRNYASLMLLMAVSTTACNGSQSAITPQTPLPPRDNPPSPTQTQFAANDTTSQTPTTLPATFPDPAGRLGPRNVPPDPPPYPLMTIEEVREVLELWSSNHYDTSTPVGALCWALWEVLRGTYLERSGNLAVLLLEGLESRQAPRTDELIETGIQPSSSRDKEVTSPTEAVDYATYYQTNYTLVEALNAASEPKIRNVALTPALPPKYRRFAEGLFALTDDLATMSNPPSPTSLIEEIPGLKTIPPSEQENFAFCQGDRLPHAAPPSDG